MYILKRESFLLFEIDFPAFYSHVDDIDLYTGAVSEKPIFDSMLGHTLNCLIVDQFVRLKKGDRYVTCV